MRSGLLKDPQIARVWNFRSGASESSVVMEVNLDTQTDNTLATLSFYWQEVVKKLDAKACTSAHKQ